VAKARDLEEAYDVLKEAINSELDLYKQSIKHGDHKNIRAHGGLLAIMLSTMVRLVAVRHKINPADVQGDLLKLLEAIPDDGAITKKTKQLLKW